MANTMGDSDSGISSTLAILVVEPNMTMDTPQFEKLEAGLLETAKHKEEAQPEKQPSPRRTPNANKAEQQSTGGAHSQQNSSPQPLDRDIKTPQQPEVTSREAHVTDSHDPASCSVCRNPPQTSTNLIDLLKNSPHQFQTDSPSTSGHSVSESTLASEPGLVFPQTRDPFIDAAAAIAMASTGKRDSIPAQGADLRGEMHNRAVEILEAHSLDESGDHNRHPEGLVPTEPSPSTIPLTADDPFTETIAAHQADLKASKSEADALPSTSSTDNTCTEPYTGPIIYDDPDTDIPEGPNNKRIDLPLTAEELAFFGPGVFGQNGWAPAPSRPKAFRKSTAHMFGPPSHERSAADERCDISSTTAERGDAVAVEEQPGTLSEISEAEAETPRPPSSPDPTPTSCVGKEAPCRPSNAVESESPEPVPTLELAYGLVLGLLFAFLSILLLTSFSEHYLHLSSILGSSHFVARVLKSYHNGQSIRVISTAIGTAAFLLFQLVFLAYWRYSFARRL